MSNELIAAAEAVIERWDSPKWKDEAPTADYIARLRRAVEASRRASSPAAVPEGALPPLPNPVRMSSDQAYLGFTSEQMRAYARAAVEADRAQQGEPVDERAAFNTWFEANKFGGMRESMWAAWEARAATKAAAPADGPSEQSLTLTAAEHGTMPTRIQAALDLLADATLPRHVFVAVSNVLHACNDELFRAAPVPDTCIPELPAELFDGHAVYSEITRHLGKSHCHNPDTVAATLDALARLMRRGTAPLPDTGIPTACPCPNLSIEHDNDTGGAFCTGKCPEVSTTPTSGKVEKAEAVDAKRYRTIREKVAADALSFRKMDAVRFDAIVDKVLGAAPSHPSEAKAGEDA